jgi:hypothetical protein
VANDPNKLPSRSTSQEVDAFLRQVATTPLRTDRAGPGRLLFALDATASREPTWDRACHIQAQMFQETTALGGLSIQLCYYRGFHEMRASPWLNDSTELLRRMTAVRCLGGQTQIERLLSHAIAETQRKRISALVFVGDAMEEDPDRLTHLAGELGLLGVPAFVFQEGEEAAAQKTFRQIARLTGGAYCPFDAGSAQQLRELLSAVAVFAAGGRKALEDFSRRLGGKTLLLHHQLRSG